MEVRIYCEDAEQLEIAQKAQLEVMKLIDKSEEKWTRVGYETAPPGLEVSDEIDTFAVAQTSVAATATEEEPSRMPYANSSGKTPAPIVEEQAATIEEAPATPTATDAELRAAVRELAEVKGLPAVVALLGAFGAARVGDIPSDKRAEFIGRTKE